MSMTTFHNAYKTLEAAKTAADNAMQESLNTGKIEVLELAQEQLAKAALDFRGLLKRKMVKVSADKVLFKPEYAALIKLAADNKIDPAKVFKHSTLTISSGRIVKADLGYLKLRDISALLYLAKLESLTILGNHHHRKKSWGKVGQILKSRGCTIKIT